MPRPLSRGLVLFVKQETIVKQRDGRYAYVKWSKRAKEKNEERRETLIKAADKVMLIVDQFKIPNNFFGMNNADGDAMVATPLCQNT